MKKTILTTTFLVAGLASVLGQGQINFNNSRFDYTDGIDRNVYVDFVGGLKVGNALWSAQLFENVGGTFQAVGGPQNFLGDIGGDFTTGQWLFATRTLNVPSGTPTTLQVRVFDATGNLLASSANFTYTPPPPGAQPADYLMTGFRAFAVPEPSTIALGVLGLGALLLFRRRK